MPESSHAHAHDLVHGSTGLLSNKCGCGKWKAKMRSFCGSCYYRLPRDMRLALYRRVGEGYEDAHANAIAFLGL